MARIATVNFLTKIGLVACVVMLSACQGPGPVVDQRPDYMSKEHIASTLFVGRKSSANKLVGWGTAVIVGPNHLLTNAHVWAVEEPWWKSELPTEQEIGFFDPAIGKHHVHEDGEPHSFTEPGFVTSTFRLVAVGVQEFVYVEEHGHEHPKNERLHDWALIETDEPRWDPEDVVAVHPAATDPDWRVPEETELFSPGFSSIFMKEGEGEEDEAGISKAALISFVQQGPYMLRGEADQVEVQMDHAGSTPEPTPSMTYPKGWPQPNGHSGSGVFLWNAERGRLELVGVLNAGAPVSIESHLQAGFIDIRVTGSAFRQTFYAPVAPALLALEKIDE